jgi:hypothetical protein
MFPLGSQWIPDMFANMFSVAPQFYPIYTLASVVLILPI